MAIPATSGPVVIIHVFTDLVRVAVYIITTTDVGVNSLIIQYWRIIREEMLIISSKYNMLLDCPAKGKMSKNCHLGIPSLAYGPAGSP